MPEAISFKLCGHGWCVQHGVISFFGFGWRYVADGLQKAAVVEPIDPFERGELHGFEVAPWSSPMDDLGLVKTVDRFGESIVVEVTNTAYRRLDARFGQPLGILDRHILGRFNRSPQHPKLGGVYGNGKTEVGAVNAA